ncbi:MAG: DUF2878 domain-containing protein [Saccharospirillum sp.]
MITKIGNYAGFQIGWFLLVLTQSVWSILWALGFMAFHQWKVAVAGEWARVGLIMVIGLGIDTLWHYSPWVSFNGTGWPIPVWLIGLWLMFPLTLAHSLAWLNNRLWLQVVFGALGGGGSYLAGAKLGAAEVTGIGWTVMPLLWGIWLPLFYRIVYWPSRKAIGAPL